MIGILDSGIGGLSIYYETKRRFPEAGVIYMADRDNFPYGEKTEAELLVIVRSAVDTLLEKGANIVVIACNSATISTINALRAEFPVPFVGIEPAVKQAENVSKNGKIGVLASKITVEKHHPEDKTLKIHNAELIEKIENDLDHVTDQDLEGAMKPFIAFGVDTMVLGCTHFSFVKDRLADLYPQITFLEPTEAVVNHLETVIHENNIDIKHKNDIFLGIDEADLPKI
jgi:glutamate racemase